MAHKNFSTEPINITKTYLPAFEDYQWYLNKIWESSQVTNNGPFVQDLENQLRSRFLTPYLQYVSSGTIALQIAIRALGIQGQIITTPFSYVATTNCIFWEDCKPCFVDIDPNTLCIDADKIEEAITPETEAILGTHIFGLPCDVEKIQNIAKRHNLKVIYDAAHAFDVAVNNESILNYGDISTLSFHATKVFHTVEGGAVVGKNHELDNAVYAMKAFGHIEDDYIAVGVNGKNSEFHAAMGLCNLKQVDEVIASRKAVAEAYHASIKPGKLHVIQPGPEVTYNYGYFPVLVNNTDQSNKLLTEMAKANIFPRRYFYPPLNSLPFHSGAQCPIAESISSRVLCLPLYHDLPLSDVERISDIINKTL